MDDPIGVHLGVTEIDGVELSGGPDGPAGVVCVEIVDGFRVHVDPIDPARFVRVESDRPGRTGWLLDELLGAGTAHAVAHGRGPQEREVRPTDAWRDVARLGLLLWLEEHSPMDFDQHLLDAEIAAAYDLIPGERARRETRRRAERAVDTIVGLGRSLRDGTEPLPPAAALVVARAAGAAIASVPGLSAASVRALTEADLAASAAAAAVAAGMTIDEEAVGLLGASTERATAWNVQVAAPGADRLRRFSVDWRLVPRGVLDIGENTIVARWLADGEAISIGVAAGPAADVADEPLAARVLRGSGEVVVVARLELDRRVGAYWATVQVPGGLGTDDRIDVYSPVASIAPLRGPVELARAEGIRYAARGLSLMRLALAAADSPASVGLWETAAGEWSTWLESADAYSPGDQLRRRDRDVVQAAVARCFEGAGQPGPARRGRQRVADPTTVPRWDDPSAAVSLAELGLLGVL